jgi:hypothetical protein
MFSDASFATSGTSFVAWYVAFPDLASVVVNFEFVASTFVPGGCHLHLYQLRPLV